MAFVAMYTWLLRGLATSVFEDRIYRFARTNTWVGVITVALSMIAGLRDAFFGNYRRLTYLSQKIDDSLMQHALSAAAFLNLDFEHLHCGYGELESSLNTQVIAVG